MNRCLGAFVVLAVVGAMAAPHLGYGAVQEIPGQIGGLGYVDDFDHTNITIDVVVRDRDVNAVTGLTRGDFRLFQDGDEVEISHFAAYTQASFGQTSPESVAAVVVETEDPDAGAITAEALPAYIIVYIDNKNLLRSDRNRVLRSLRTFFADSLGGPVRVMVVSYQHSIEVVQPFTNNPGEVVNALQRLRLTEVSGDDRLEDHKRLMREIRKASKDTHRRAVGRGQSIPQIYGSIHSFAREEMLRLDDTLAGIRDTVTAMTGITGRKYLIYVSNGLPLVPCKDLLHEFAELDRLKAQTDAAAPYKKRKDYEALAAAASAQEITIHTIDATGSYSQAAQLGEADAPQSSATRVIARDNLRAPLKLLAEKTGGLAVIDTDDFGAAMERIRSDLQTYYSIGYELDSRGSDTVHHIEVRLDDESEYETRYRRTVVERSMHTRVQDEVTAGLFFDVGDNPLGLEVTPGAQVKATETRWMQPLTVSLPVTSVAMIPDGEEVVAQVVLFIALRNLAGTSTDVQRHSHEFRLPADEYEKRKGDPFTVPLRLLFEEGRHNIVVGALDELTRQTSFHKLEMSCPGKD